MILTGHRYLLQSTVPGSQRLLFFSSRAIRYQYCTSRYIVPYRAFQNAQTKILTRLFVVLLRRTNLTRSAIWDYLRFSSFAHGATLNYHAGVWTRRSKSQLLLVDVLYSSARRFLRASSAVILSKSLVTVWLIREYSPPRNVDDIANISFPFGDFNLLVTQTYNTSNVERSIEIVSHSSYLRTSQNLFTSLSLGRVMVCTLSFCSYTNSSSSMTNGADATASGIAIVLFVGS